MKNRSDGKILALALAAVGTMGAGVWFLFVKGPLGESFFWNGNPGVFAELALVFAWMAGSLCLVRDRGRGLLLAVLGALAFSWCHRAFLPLLAAGGYCGFLLLLGKGTAEALGGFFGKREGKRLLRSGGQAGENGAFLLYSILGASVWMVLVCLLSAFGVGGVPLWRALAAGLGILLGLREILPRTRRAAWKEADSRLWKRCCGRSFWESLVLAVVMTCLLLQVGRMNVALDYDSLHYGLRSPYILDNGHGIYENLGNINVVYTYAKGLEILALPLSGTSTYGYVLAFNLWIGAGVLFLGGRMAGFLGGRRCGALAAAVMALTPGILNMAVTAKSDLLTLFFQMAALFALLLLLEAKKEERLRWLLCSMGACMVSYTLKPTAVVFSTALTGSGVLYAGWLWFREGRREGRALGLKAASGSLGLFVFPALAWAGVWARTYLMTGMPSTSVFTSIWELLGFEVQWPFAFSSIPNEGLSMGFFQGLLHLGDRLLKMCFAPIGEDMDHVIIAWGTGLLFLGLLAVLLFGKTAFSRAREKKRAGQRLLYLELALMSVLSVVSVYLLWQVDGNYFMMWYVLAAVCGSMAVTSGAAVRGKGLKRWCLGLAAVTIAFQISVTALTSWAGAVGFTPIALIHGGYYDHLAETRERAQEEGRSAIWELLSADPTNRVIAFGEHPECLDLACNVQSYYDVTGSGGNVVLVKTLENFKEFLRYAKIQYVYAEAGHLEEGTREWDVLRYLVEEGSLTDIVYENGNMAAKVSLDGAGYGPKEAAQAAEEFYRMMDRRKP